MGRTFQIQGLACGCHAVDYLLSAVLLGSTGMSTKIKVALAALGGLALYKAMAGSSSPKSIEGKVIVVTGSATGIGRELAFLLAKQGAEVVMLDINQTQLEATADDIREGVPGSKIHTYVCDISSRTNVYEVAERIKEEVNTFVWGLVNNAGIVTGTYLMDTDDARIEKTFEVNSLAHFWTVKSFLPEMLERNDGHIVTVSSMASYFAAPKMVDYAASKFAARGFHAGLRSELMKLGKDGIGMSCICPAHTNTELFKGFNSPQVPTMTPTFVAEQMLSAIQFNKVYVHLPPELSKAVALQGLLPQSIVDSIDRDNFNVMDGFDTSKAETIFGKMDVVEEKMESKL